MTRGSLRQIMCRNGEYKKWEILIEELNRIEYLLVRATDRRGVTMTKKINRGQSLKDKKSADVQGGWFVYLLLKFALNYETFLFRPRCEEDTSQEFIVN